MILGEVCTRSCHFCAVVSGDPESVELAEPQRVAELVLRLELVHAVVTSVTRDDLPDGGASHFAATIRAIREVSPGTSVEVLTPDYNGDVASLNVVLDAEPEVFGHNIETVRRLYPELRDKRYNYDRALDVLRHLAHQRGTQMVVKSGLMVGLGETDEEVYTTLEDLLTAGCQAVCIGQYLRPSAGHWPVSEFVTPERFSEYERRAREMGFQHVASGPFVRSSYHSDTLVQREKA
jgi:lipoic acid synthetase